MDAHRVLGEAVPFRFLLAAERAALAADLEELRFEPGDTIIRQGEDDERVFLLAEGSVETIDRFGDAHALVGSIGAGHYFGERAALFGEKRRYEIRAASKARAFAMSGERFLRLLAESRGFAQGLGDILRDRQGIFAGFDEFLAHLQLNVAQEEVRLSEILPRYLALEPALHPCARLPDVVDFGALGYALRRLPHNITRSLSLFLTDNLPELYQRPDRAFKPIPTDARPRAVYEMLPGKSMVLIRDGLSDLVDLVTCLCLYCIEARKLRKRVRRPEQLEQLSEYLRAGRRDASAFLSTLPFSPEEVEKLTVLWPEEPVARLHELVLHHEDVTLHVRKQTGSYNSRHSDLWSAQLATATHKLLGREPAALPVDFDVHVISSNTHSVINCLSAYLTARADEILEWARLTAYPLSGGFRHRMDHVYALSRDYFEANAAACAARERADAEAGILRLHETAFTGIQVQLVAVERLAAFGAIDADVTPPPRRPALIVNIDFAFGQQAEEIISNLIMLFGRNLRSVNVLGKAGALVGRRGDILLPTLFVEQASETMHPLPEFAPAALERLRERAGTIDVHVGPLLTVTGTLVQNRKMLNFYRRVWRCVGLEMEGSYYHRKLFESAQLGVIANDVALRYLYYVSDLPLDESSTLAGRMHAEEGVPPLYAITREILSGIFDA